MTTGDTGTGGEAGVGYAVSGKDKLKGRGSNQEMTKRNDTKQEEEERSEGVNEDGKLPMDRVFPTPDEAEWA